MDPRRFSGRAGLLKCVFQDFHQGQKVRRFTCRRNLANFLHDSPCPSFIQLRYHPGRRNHVKPTVVSVSESRLLRRVFNTLIYAYNMFHSRMWCQNFEFFTLLIPTWQNDLIWQIFSDELKPSTTYTYQLVLLTVVVHHFAYFCCVYISHGRVMNIDDCFRIIFSHQTAIQDPYFT